MLITLLGLFCTAAHAATYEQKTFIKYQVSHCVIPRVDSRRCLENFLYSHLWLMKDCTNSATTNVATAITHPALCPAKFRPHKQILL